MFRKKSIRYIWFIDICRFFFIEEANNMPWQSLPPFIIMVGAIGAMGGLQFGVHYLFEGETRKIGRDRFDMINRWRDSNIQIQKDQAAATAAGGGHH